MQHPLRTAYRTLAGVIGLVSVGWLYGLVVLDGGPVLSGSVRYFSFFTILTNLLAAAAMLLPVWAPATRMYTRTTCPGPTPRAGPAAGRAAGSRSPVTCGRLRTW